MVTVLALMSRGTPIHDMAGNACKVTLVTAFKSLVMGLYWKLTTNQSAVCALSGGLTFWLLMERFGGDWIWPPQPVGLLVSLGGMVLASLQPQRLRAASPAPT